VLSIYFVTASSYINIPLPAFLEVFEEDLESTFWEAIELSEWTEFHQTLT
jgi:hypothetical protein